ncbi:MAG: adenylate/guanylate cyclase domain-containing protein [Pseudomonadota bacterium]
MERHLAAILAADVAGYSRLVGADEEAAIKRLAKLRGILADRVAEAGGRIFGEAGDGFVAEFASPVKAVRCAVETQRDLVLENRELEADSKMMLRIGVHLADVIVENGTLLGDGVNIASRIEAGCAPGEVHISAPIYDQVAKSAGFGFTCLGPKAFKNIEGPTTVYAVAGDIEVNRLQNSQRQEGLAPPLPDKPSIVVLPFTNMSDDAEQAYFSDGFTEDVITELSRFKSIFVISRHASFAYKDEAVDLTQVGRELGVRYVLEGSVRRLGPRVRITAQLIEAQTNNHVWAERYDAKGEELFDVQDELIGKIVATIANRVQSSSMDAAKRQPPDNIEAYDCLLRGLSFHHVGGLSRENAEQAVTWIEKAIELSPNFARAHAWRACAGSWNWLMDDRGEWYKRSVDESNRALDLDPNESEAHRIVGAIALYEGDFRRSEVHHEKAIELNPNDAYVKARSAVHYIAVGNFDRALELVHQAMRQDPFLPDWCREEEFVALYLNGQHEEARDAFNGLGRPSLRALAYRVGNQACLEDPGERQDAVAALLRVDPDFRASAFVKSEPKFADRVITDRILRDLTSAGLPA